MVRMHILAPSFTPQGGIGVRIVSIGMVGTAREVNLHILKLNVCGFTHYSGCVVDGNVAMTTFLVLLLFMFHITSSHIFIL